MPPTLKTPSPTVPAKWHPVVVLAGVYALGGGGISLLGWVADIPRFTDWINRGVSIQPNSALGALLCGIALLLRAAHKQRSAGFIGATVLILALAAGVHWTTDADLGIDGMLLFGRKWGGFGVVSPGRMGPPACISFALLGASFILACARSSKYKRIATYFSLTALAIAAISTTSFFYGANSLHALPRLTIIAFQTATFILAIAAGVIASLPDQQPMRTLADPGAAGIFSRRALPLLILVPFLVGLVRVRMQESGYFDTGFGSTIRTVVEIAAMLSLFWWIAAIVRRHEVSERNNSDRMRGLLASIPDAFFSVDSAWRFTFVNDQLVQRFQLPRDQIIGRSLWELFPAAIGNEAHRMLHRAMAERISVAYEVYYEPWQKWFHDRASPASDGGLTVFSRDVTERKLHVQAQARLAAIVQTSEDAMISKNLESIITTWNGGAVRIFGYTPEEAIGRHISLIIPEDRATEEPGIIDKIRRGESVGHYETVRRRKDGTLVDVSIAVSPVVDPVTGVISGASKVARDITERKKAAAIVLRNQEALALLVQNAPFGIYVVDSEFKLSMVNRGSELGLFANVRPVVGHDFEAAIKIIWPPAIAESVIRVFRKTLATGEPFYSKNFMERRSDIGQVQAYEWELHRITLPDGTFAVVCYSFDSTKLREAEQALRSARNEIQQTLDTAAVGLAHINRDHRFVAANPAYSEIAGLPLDQIVGHSLEEVMGTEALASIRPYIQRALQGERVDYETQIPWTTGGPKHVHVVFTPWLDAQRIVTGWVASVADITARKLAEDELRQHRENLQNLVNERTIELESSFRRLRAAEQLGSLGTLAAGLGHDIGNLILPLSVRLECLQEAALPADSREDVEAIVGCVGYLNQLSSSLRLLSASPRDTLSRRSAATHLDRWCDMATPLFKAITPKGCVCRCWTSTAGLVAAIDEARLLQAVFNLVQNAAEAIKDSPVSDQREKRIDVHTSVSPNSPDTILIEVSDTGPGMSDEVRQRCLEPYFTTKRKELSGGLGLALVRQYVEEAGGTMAVRSREGEGTTFSLTFPRIQASLATPTTQAAPSESTSLRTASVTVSEPRTASLLSWTLRAAGISALNIPAADPPHAGLWIVDAQHAAAAVAHAKRDDCAAMVIGSTTDSLKDPELPNLIFTGNRPTAASLRSAIERLLRPSHQSKASKS